MKINKIFIIILSLIFFGLLIYFIMTVSNKLIGFRVIKDYGSLNKDGILNFDELKNKYKIDKCNQVCKQEFCDEYQVQHIKYDLCKDCNSKGKCYDEYKGICVPCENTYTCEQLFGCSGNKPPIDPIQNYCTRCWLGADQDINNNIVDDENSNLYLSSEMISEGNISSYTPSSATISSSSIGSSYTPSSATISSSSIGSSYTPSSSLSSIT